LNDFDAAVLEFFNDYPLTITYIQSVNGSYDPATSEYTVSEIATECKAILLDLTHINNGLSTKYGTQIVSGDKELYLLPPEKDFFSAPLIITPSSDKVVVNNVTYTVAAMKEINPTGNAPIVYTFHIQR